jgi:site-specific DNA-adenine methylase
MAFYIRNCFSNIIPTPVEFPKEFTAWKERIEASRTQIWNVDGIEALKSLNSVEYEDGTNTTEYQVYEDPPYVGTEGFYSKKKFDHAALARVNHETTHRVILSYNDCRIVRELYADWNVVELESYSNMKKERNVELLLSNRPLVRSGRGRTSAMF